MDQTPAITDESLAGLAYFKKLRPLFARLHAAACDRDTAHNRKLHYDQYACLILLALFNPAIDSLRDIVSASALNTVRRKLGVKRTSLGSLSEAARVFDADLLEPIVHELAGQLQPVIHDPALAELKQVLTLVDGTILKALPRITQAMWLTNASGHDQHAFRLHTHFELLNYTPVWMELTDAKNSKASSERGVLEASLQSDRAYVMDRGYVKFSLFNAIVAKGSSYFCRLREDTLLAEVEDRPLSKADRSAGVVRDVVVKLGTTCRPSASTDHPVRVVMIPLTPHQRRGGRKGQQAGPSNNGRLWIATNRLDVPAHVVGLVYRYRYAIEIFFRFFKHLLGCRHLLSDSANGIRIQVYCAMIACLLIGLYTQRKPTRQTLAMVNYFLMGWATEAELMEHLKKPDRTGVKLAAKAAVWAKLGL
jgi:hypothetical protein